MKTILFALLMLAQTAFASGGACETEGSFKWSSKTVLPGGSVLIMHPQYKGSTEDPIFISPYLNGRNLNSGVCKAMGYSEMLSVKTTTLRMRNFQVLVFDTAGTVTDVSSTASLEFALHIVCR